MSKIRIATIQQNLVWENPTANQQLFEAEISKLQNVDLVILPEMFNTGFTMNPKPVAQKKNGETAKWLKSIALKYNLAIIGSLAIEENSKFYNRLFAVLPSGQTFFYDKKHLFRMGGEHKEYTAGRKKIVFEHLGWRICPLVCYDLRFPIWSRNTNNYDLLIYVANWPSVRNHAWQTLLQARAIENQCYTIGVNRIGTDGNKLEYIGNSLVINPKGEIITKMKSNDIVAITELNLVDLQRFKEKFPSYLDADKFTINAN